LSSLPPLILAKVKATLEQPSNKLSRTPRPGISFLPDPRTYRHLIGQGGSKVNSICKASGCKITVPKNRAENKATEIIGSAEGVVKAKDLILQAVKDGATNGGGNGGRYEGRGSGGNTSKTGNGNWD
jgi:polyribonucleotide nucleotidyltransferase